MLTTHDLVYSYPEKPAFSFPDIEVKDSQTLLILGQSGSGKTTLLNMLGLFLKPQNGIIKLQNQELNKLNNKTLVDFRAKNIGIIHQKPYFVNALNVLENLILSNYLAKTKLNKTKALELAKKLDIEHTLDKKVQELSGGEQQRICIARAMMNTPKLLLADEPTSALDDTNCDKVLNLLQEQSNAINAALIIVTHDQRLKSRYSNQITL